MEPSQSICDKEDIFDIYRKEYENDEHWNLRKSFLIFHRGNFENEQILLRNAQLFTSIEMLGCKYSNVIMQEIAELANQVPEIIKYREVKRYFRRQLIGAVDSAKLKYTKELPKPLQQQTQHPPNEIKLESKREYSDWSKIDKHFWFLDSRRKENEYNLFLLDQQHKFESRRDILKDVVVFEDQNGLFDLIKTSVFMKKIGKFEQSYNDNEIGKYLYVFNGEVLAEGKAENKISAKKKADKALEIILRGYCYRIRSKVTSYTADEDNQGLHMLQALGYKGNSIDFKNHNILDRINLSINVRRLGLENNNTSFDKMYFDDLLKNYKRNPSEYDLIFSPEFTKDERAIIHQ